jgi:hypothetical protein
MDGNLRRNDVRKYLPPIQNDRRPGIITRRLDRQNPPQSSISFSHRHLLKQERYLKISMDAKEKGKSESEFQLQKCLDGRESKP